MNLSQDYKIYQRKFGVASEFKLSHFLASFDWRKFEKNMLWLRFLAEHPFA